MLEQLRILFFEHPNPVLYAIPFFNILIIIEFYLNYKERLNLYLIKDSIASITMGIGSLFVDIFTKSFYFLLMLWLYQFGLFKEQLFFRWEAWVLLFFLDDFSFYWHHRISHVVRILWASHVVHHSSERYNLSTALRQSWTEVGYKYIFYLWLPLLGFHPLMVLTMISISLIYQFWIHTQVIDKLPKIIEFIFNTPAHHRVHHASNPRYLDCNYGGILIIWDRIFNSLTIEDPQEPVIYGITTNINSYNPFYIASHEFLSIAKEVKAAKTWSEKMKCFLMFPQRKSKQHSQINGNENDKSEKDKML